MPLLERIADMGPDTLTPPAMGGDAEPREAKNAPTKFHFDHPNSSQESLNQRSVSDCLNRSFQFLYHLKHIYYRNKKFRG
jgi:hypothetical protein